MHINMKYYIVTIGAIFIALGIGMLVGFNLNYDQELSKQQASMIKDLDSKFEVLKTTNDNLEENLTNLNKDYDEAIAIINQNSDKIIKDSLVNKNIGIISTNEKNDYSKEIASIIQNAGGNVAFDIVLTSNIENKDALKKASEELSIELNNAKDVINYIAESLKEEGSISKLENLQRLELIKVESIAENYIDYDSVVLTGGSEDKAQKENFDKIDEALITKLKEQNKYIVGVQKSNTKNSYIDLYSKNKIATIDNIEEGIGKVSLTILLNEKGATGDFGRLESAKQLFPYKK
ncbi:MULTISPECIES: copper transporter [unclassified Romboutsia]|uniref:copper transporter n=1 Tax=unclassified Romboutsia TaxID=2626894 RepID=UPI001896E3F1|nr:MULTISPECIES: copper transporter [unclassified Romboutsia]MDB8804511.1 copper transporter [Romboutsia sp. 1001216sp1]MDB8806565.1 copper transporter [Romboutsia sp. 1001216sp1]MDB8810159.1 copper transporter [Romboutsia sp. 1001216sp1]MDB8815906.1 copper transporter [Romboutsia sp. 1001216sp1]MDB8818356.1 copper transporter [Romboutsia sp. 1001216sp1]